MVQAGPGAFPLHVKLPGDVASDRLEAPSSIISPCPGGYMEAKLQVTCPS